MKGKVFLVGAGPGDPELLTVKALRLLQTADAILYDELVSQEVLKLVPSTAQLHNVGKRCGKKKIQQEEINFLMIALAESGLNVVRLKSGDPSIFGRAGEEMEALRNANVPYELVPGVTSALGAAAAAEIPLTHRRFSSAVVFITGQQAANSDAADWNKLASSGATLVIYMPGHDYAAVAAKLNAAGVSSDTPCATISRATNPDQRTFRTRAGELHLTPRLPSPTLLVVGEVVRFAQAEHFALPTGVEGPFTNELISAFRPNSVPEEPVA
ncbi:MAG TPA: uroporphyrinogen-III C-methyltransferase [Dongiaceae bacterium]|nr:uroporphyrinogen-III C-methyltransferase [Dongiaceae bacterium]